MRANRDIRDIEVIAPNLKRRHTGVTSTIAALLPVQARTLKIAALGSGLPDGLPRVSLLDVLRHGWKRPPNRRFRIWHARRNNETLLGLFLRSILRMPLKIVFTSAARRSHTWITRALLNRTDSVIATSPEADSHLRVPAHVILHGVDMNVYHPAKDRAQEWAEAKLPGRYGIGIFGRVRAQKGTDLFVEAMCRLLPKYPDFTAVIIGAATADQKIFTAGLKKRAAEAGLEDRIVFLGELEPEEVPLWFRRMTVVVCAQRWEGFGLVPVEAMASGAAVVATRVGAAHHIVVENDTGFLVQPEDLDTLTSQIEILMKDPELAAKYGQQGRIRASQHFSIEREAAEIQQVYENCWSDTPIQAVSEM